jgi:hypothetical protein
MTESDLSAKGLWRLTRIFVQVNRQAGTMEAEERPTEATIFMKRQEVKGNWRPIRGFEEAFKLLKAGKLN